MELDGDRFLKIMVAVDSIAAMKGQRSLVVASDNDDNGDFTSPIYNGWRDAVGFLFANERMLPAIIKKIEERGETS